MATSLSGYPLFINNNLSSSNMTLPKQRLKHLMYWNKLDRPLSQEYFGLRIHAEKDAITIVCFHPETRRIFAFNATYPVQAEKRSKAILIKINRGNLSPSSFEILKIYPYKKLLLQTYIILNRWIASKLPGSNIEDIFLEKNESFILNFENGRGIKEHQIQNPLEKGIRKVKKFVECFLC